MQTRHLKGFTLIEIMMALALTGMVLVLGGFIYRVFVQFQHRYQAQVDQTYDSALLQHQLWQDFGQAWQLDYSPHEWVLQNRRGEPLFRYELREGLLIRYWNDVSDSLSFSGISLPLDQGIQLQDTVHNRTYTFYLPPRSHVKNP